MLLAFLLFYIGCFCSVCNEKLALEATVHKLSLEKKQLYAEKMSKCSVATLFSMHNYYYQHYTLCPQNERTFAHCGFKSAHFLDTVYLPKIAFTFSMLPWFVQS